MQKKMAKMAKVFKKCKLFKCETDYQCSSRFGADSECVLFCLCKIGMVVDEATQSCVQDNSTTVR